MAILSRDKPADIAVELGVVRHPLAMRYYYDRMLLAFMLLVSVFVCGFFRIYVDYFGQSYTAPTVVSAVDDYRTAMSQERWDLPGDNNFLEIAVPVSKQDDKLQIFCLQLSASFEDFFRRTGKDLRSRTKLLISRYRHDNSSEALKSTLSRLSSLEEHSVVFVNVETSLDFSRSSAINSLHRAGSHRKDSVKAILDVDLRVGSRFFFNVLDIVSPSTIYFPVVWSQYNPEKVAIMEGFFEDSFDEFNPHTGLWRKFGYGMYALSGFDSMSLLMNESFVGWGGEDNDFHARAMLANWTIVRQEEPSLIHVWHPKNCKAGSFVEFQWMKNCIGSRDVMEGSPETRKLLGLASEFALYAREIPSHFFRIVRVLYGLLMALPVHSLVRLRPRDVFVFFDSSIDVEIQTALLRTKLDLRKKFGGVNTEISQVPILIGVTSSRRNFGTRVKELQKSWANPDELPSWTKVVYFVGHPLGKDNKTQNGHPVGSLADIRSLAHEAGLVDEHSIYVLHDVDDDEYPLVHKANAIIKGLYDIAKQSDFMYEWIFDVDDDTYVNMRSLEYFLSKQRPERFKYFGQRAFGGVNEQIFRQAGLQEPYCMGGPGILLSRLALQALAAGIESCTEELREQMPLYDDTIIGFCLQKHTGRGCEPTHPTRFDIFYHHYAKNSSDFPYLVDTALLESISLHPFKSPGLIVQQHDQIRKTWAEWDQRVRFGLAYGHPFVFGDKP